MGQLVDSLTDFIHSVDFRVPLVLRTLTPGPPNSMHVGGTVSSAPAVSEYILLSALPPELKERVVTAIKAQMVG